MSDSIQGGVRSTPPKATFGPRQEIQALTGLRALAAVWVVLFHLKHLFALVLPTQGFWLSAALSTGYLGVDLFFVLSGFIIAYNYAEAFTQFSWRRYMAFLWARLCRVYPVHLFALITMLVVAAALSEGDSIWQTSYFSTEAFVGNLLMTHGWALPLDKTWNVPAWSISSEWFAYLFFPIFLALTLRLRRPPAAALFTLVLLIGAGLVYWLTDYPSHAAYGMVRIVVGFSLGCLLFQFYKAGIGAELSWGVIVPVCFAGTVAAATMWHAADLRPIVWVPLPLAAMVYGLAWGKGILARWLAHPFAVYWGKVSYALYMTHYICLFAIESQWPSTSLPAASLAIRTAYLLMNLAAMLAAAAITYHLIEEPLRRRLRRLWPAAAPRGDNLGQGGRETYFGAGGGT